MRQSRTLMSKRRRVVAVVDDDRSMLRATKDLLEALGLAAVVFASAEEFLADGPAANPDCLLLDIHLGGMSGLELRRRLAVSTPKLPVIFMTALDDERTRLEAKRADSVAVLHKPYSARQLMDAIEKAIP